MNVEEILKIFLKLSGSLPECYEDESGTLKGHSEPLGPKYNSYIPNEKSCLPRKVR